MAHPLAPALVTALVTALLLGSGTGAAPASADTQAVGPASGSSTAAPGTSTTFRIATFNVLGNSHTTKHGDKPDRPSGTKRMAWTVQALDAARPSIVGFQEMERIQYGVFRKLTGGTYATYPGDDPDQLVVANNIAWRTDTWRLLSATTFTAPYFYGKYSRRPLVLLQNVHTGQEVYVMNTHNPADVRGKAAKWRNQAVAIEAALITHLRSTHPGIPVLFTGDMNDWANFYCPITAKAPVHSAYGGTHVLTPTNQCTPPTFANKGINPKPIDWIVGTPDVAFSGATQLQDSVVKQASDHPLYWATATVHAAPARRTGITHIVAIDAEGLSSAALAKAGTKHAPFLTRLRAAGASTLDARTEPDSTRVLPNAVGMLTGRKVLKKGGGGHGVKRAYDDGKSVAKHAGGHVDSVYDVAHRFGRSTALYSSDRSARMIKRSWKHRIGRSVLARDDSALTTAFRKSAKHLTAFTFVQLTGLVRAGQKSGWNSAPYQKALKRLDHRIAAIVHQIQAHPATARTTMVVVTASAGGRRHSTSGSKPANFKVPFLVWGHGVPAKADLYALNPALLRPGSTNPGLSVGQPVRTAMLADLATSALGLPAVRGGIFDSGQDLNVTLPPASGLPPDPANQRAAVVHAK
jgi:endonuclease/exonuclease/phosphatase family metal-dependent hydrolase